MVRGLFERIRSIFVYLWLCEDCHVQPDPRIPLSLWSLSFFLVGQPSRQNNAYVPGVSSGANVTELDMCMVNRAGSEPTD